MFETTKNNKIKINFNTETGKCVYGFSILLL